MLPPSEAAIARFLSETSSTRDRALLYLTITDGNADRAVAIFKRKPYEGVRTVHSRPASQFRRHLANDPIGYEDEDGVIHLETSTDDEGDDEGDDDGDDEGDDDGDDEGDDEGNDKGDDEAEDKIVVKATKKAGRRKRGAADRDATYEPEEIRTRSDKLSRTRRGKLPSLRNRSHRSRHARNLGAPGFKSLGVADNGKSISSRKPKSLTRVERLPSKIQDPRLRPRNKLITYGSPKKRVAHFTPPPRTTTQPFIIPIPCTRPSVQRQSSEEYEPYVNLTSSAQSRFKQMKENTSGIANPGTPGTGLSSNPSGKNSYLAPFSHSASRLDTGRMTTNTGNLQDQSEGILHSSFHRSSFESMSPMANESEYYEEGETDHHQRDASEIQLQVLSNSKKTKTDIPLKETSYPQDPSEEILHSSFHRSSFESLSPVAIKSEYYDEGETDHYQRDASKIRLQVFSKSKEIKTNIPMKDAYPQDPSEGILHSSFQRSFESMSPVAIKSEYYDEGETDHHQRDAFEIPPQVFSNSKKTKTGIPPKDPSSISLSKYSFRNAMNLAREKRKWLIINLQSATVPACEVLNREIWRHPDIADIVSQSFILFQLDNNDGRADVYLEKYCSGFDLDQGDVEVKQEDVGVNQEDVEVKQEDVEANQKDVEVNQEDVEVNQEDVEVKKKGERMGWAVQGGNRRFVELPHIALLDPITEQRWKFWNGPGVPDKDRFLADLSEYEMMGEGGWSEWGTGVIGQEY